MESASESEDSFESCAGELGSIGSDSGILSTAERTSLAEGINMSEDKRENQIILSAEEKIKKVCICEHLEKILHDGCRSKIEMEATVGEQFEATLHHFMFIRAALDCLQKEYKTLSPYECPKHGVLPERVQQSRCSFCVGSFSSMAVGAADKYDAAVINASSRMSVAEEDNNPDEETSVTASLGSGLSPEEKEKRKILNKASKKLLKLKHSIEATLKERSKGDKILEVKIDRLESNRKEVEKLMRDHMAQMHSLLDHYHQNQLELLRQRHRDFLQEVLLTKTEGLNFEGRLVDLQKQIEEKRTLIIKHHDLDAAISKDIEVLSYRFRSSKAAEPSVQTRTVTYTMEVPQVTSDDLQTLLGQLVISDDISSPLDRPSPPLWPVHGTTPGGSAERSTTSTAAWAYSQEQQASRTTPGGSADRSTAPTAASAYSQEQQASRTTPGGSADRSTAPTAASAYSQEQQASRTTPGGSAERSTASMAAWAYSQEPQASGVAVKSFADVLREDCPKDRSWTRKLSFSLAAEDKLTEKMASTTSIASSASSVTKSSRRRTRSRTRKKKNKNGGKAASKAEPRYPLMITVPLQPAAPTKMHVRGKVPAGFASKPDGQLWIVYGDKDPHLDLIDEKGRLLQSTKIGGNTHDIVSFSEDNVLISCHSPRCQLKLLDEKKEAREIFELSLTPTGLAVGSTGIAVSGYKSIYWIPLDGEQNEWVVKEKGSPLKAVCACEVVILHGRSIVCVADKAGQEVCFYDKLESGGFAALPPFRYLGDKNNGFSPISISAHPAGFLAVLDAGSQSVIMVNVEKNEAVSVIPRSHLCAGVPAIIAFAFTNFDDSPKLWVGSSTGHVYLASLAFQY